MPRASGKSFSLNFAREFLGFRADPIAHRDERAIRAIQDAIAHHQARNEVLCRALPMGMILILDADDRLREASRVIGEIVADWIERGDRIETGALEERISLHEGGVILFEHGERIDDHHGIRVLRLPVRPGQGRKRPLRIDDEDRPVLEKDEVRDQEPPRLTRSIRPDRHQMPVGRVAVEHVAHDLPFLIEQ